MAVNTGVQPDRLRIRRTRVRSVEQARRRWHWLELEVTEGASCTTSEQCAAFEPACPGKRPVAIDDFGTGYCRSSTSDARVRSRSTRALSGLCLTIGQAQHVQMALGLRTSSACRWLPGVKRWQRDCLRQMSDLLQGYLVSAPMTAGTWCLVWQSPVAGCWRPAARSPPHRRSERQADTCLDTATVRGHRCEVALQWSRWSGCGR